MRKLDTETLLFFDGHEDALALYRTLEERLYETFPVVNKRVQKTLHIALPNGRFCGAKRSRCEASGRP